MSERIPWRRAFVEGLVIVGSILLALALDAWWDGVQEREEEQTLIANLHTEFRSLRATLEDGLVGHRRILENSRAAAEFEESGQQHSDFTRLFRPFYTQITTHLETGTLDGMLSAGQVGLISDNSLRALLAAWPSTLNEFSEEEERITLLSDRSRIVLAESVPVAARVIQLRLDPEAEQSDSAFSEAFISFLESQAGRNYAALRFDREYIAIRDGETLLRAVDDILTLLEQQRR